MAIKDIIHTIEERVGHNRPNVEAQAILLKVDKTLELQFGCVVDPSLITQEMLDDVKAFNDQAGNNIRFEGGEIVNHGVDNAMFMFMFTADKCEGGM